MRETMNSASEDVAGYDNTNTFADRAAVAEAAVPPIDHRRGGTADSTVQQIQFAEFLRDNPGFDGSAEVSKVLRLTMSVKGIRVGVGFVEEDHGRIRLITQHIELVAVDFLVQGVLCLLSHPCHKIVDVVGLDIKGDSDREAGRSHQR